MILKTNYERFIICKQIKSLKDIILEKLVINKNTKINNYSYHPKD